MKHFLFAVIGILIVSLAGTVSAREMVSHPLEAPELIQVKAESVKIRQMTGVVKGIDLASGILDLENRRGKKSFSIVSDTQYKKGREKLDLKDLHPGTRVVVKYKDLGDTRQAKIIRLKAD